MKHVICTKLQGNRIYLSNYIFETVVSTLPLSEDRVFHHSFSVLAYKDGSHLGSRLRSTEDSHRIFVAFFGEMVSLTHSEPLPVAKIRLKF